MTVPPNGLAQKCVVVAENVVDQIWGVGSVFGFKTLGNRDKACPRVAGIARPHDYVVEMDETVPDGPDGVGQEKSVGTWIRATLPVFDTNFQFCAFFFPSSLV